MTRREFLELLEILSATGLSERVSPGLVILFKSQNPQTSQPPLPQPAAPPPPPPPPPSTESAPQQTQVNQMLSATQALNDHVSSFIEQAHSTMTNIANQPAVLSGGPQLEVSTGPITYSVSAGVTVSFDQKTGNFTAGLFLNVTRAINSEPSVGIAPGVTGGAGTGDPHGFYGDSNVVSANGPIGGISYNSNQTYNGVNGTLAVGIGTPNVTISTQSYTYGESTMTTGNVYHAISDVENDLWNASQDPMNPQTRPSVPFGF